MTTHARNYRTAVSPPGLGLSHDLRHVPVARFPFARFLGLIGRRDPERLFLVIPRCSSVHTWFMRTRIDVAFLNGGGIVLAVVEGVRRWTVIDGPPNTESVLELPPGYARKIGLSRGDHVSTRLSAL